MTTHRFYVPAIDPADDRATLSHDQSRQASRVLRLQSGDRVVVFDGRGWEYPGRLAGKVDDHLVVEFTDRRQPGREPAVLLTVGLSLIRNERFDLAVQKLTELGVGWIVPVIAERCVISYKDEHSWQKRRARLERIVVEAAEQSERATLPVLDDPQTISEFLDERESHRTLALVERRPKLQITEFEPPTRELSLVIGPEGGWTEDEIALIEHHATPVGLGKLILRSETAAIAAAGHLIFCHGTWDRHPS